MATFLGTTVIDKLYLGTTPIQFIYQGTLQIWANEVVAVLTSSNTVVIKALFAGVAGLWASTTTKRVSVPSGVTIGSTVNEYAMVLQAYADGLAGSYGGKLIVDIAGTISGIGGAANSGVGGTCLLMNFTGKDGQKADVNVKPGGLVRSGGGGGGMSGTGGQGVYTTPRTVTEGPYYTLYQYEIFSAGNGVSGVYWGGLIGNYTGQPTTIGGVRYYYGTLGQSFQNGDSDEGYYTDYHYYVYRQYEVLDYFYPLGGAARPGGRGQGFDGAAAAGGAAVGGAGSGAGASGTGGTGAAWGATGGTGTNGANGNYANGTAGAVGGLAGFYLNGAANCNFVNEGTVQGRVA